jgi:hypothetical protein
MPDAYPPPDLLDHCEAHYEAESTRFRKIADAKWEAGHKDNAEHWHREATRAGLAAQALRRYAQQCRAEWARTT